MKLTQPTNTQLVMSRLTSSRLASPKLALTRLAFISIIGLFITACGGGGGESSSATPAATPVAAPAPTPAPIVDTTVTTDTPTDTASVNDDAVPDPDAVYESTAELVAAKSFLISQEYELEISYKNDDNRQAYLSVCTDYSEGNNGIKVNYNSCLLRTPINSNFNDILTVANDKNQLVMAIWYLDNANTPRYETWENSGDVNTAKAFHVN